MAQKDYVSRGRPSPARRKKSNSRKKQRSAVSPTMVAIAAAVLVAFIGGLWFITHHKKEEADNLPGHKATGNGLPPKPEERWRYIKELESRQPGITKPTEPSSGGENIHQDQLTDEQRQLLEQMQADMRQQPTPLNEVPWNEQTPAQRQQTLQRQRQMDTQRQQFEAKQRQVDQQRQQQQRQIDQERQQQLRQMALERQQQLRRMEQERQAQTAKQQVQRAPADSPSPGIRADKPANATRQAPAPAQTQAQKPASTEKEVVPANTAAAEPKDARRWMIQCGSFKGSEPAEKVRAQLAFEGFDSHVTTNNGWNRVMIGPLTGKNSTDAMLKRLQSSGHANCIRVAAGG